MESQQIKNTLPEPQDLSPFYQLESLASTVGLPVAVVTRRRTRATVLPKPVSKPPSQRLQ